MMEYLENYLTLVTIFCFLGMFIYFIAYPKKDTYLFKVYRRRINVELHISGLVMLEFCLVLLISFILGKNIFLKLFYIALSYIWISLFLRDFCVMKTLEDVQEKLENEDNNDDNISM